MAEKRERDGATFEEIGRVRVSATTEVVVSTVTKTARADIEYNGIPVANGESYIIGISVSEFITSPRYTGFAKGILIPNDKIADFAKLINSLGA